MQRIFQRLSVLLMLAQATVCAGATLDFSGGFANSASSLNYNASAQISGSKARLTNGGALQVGTVWSKNQIDIRKFSCQFTFQITSPNESGFTFTIQRAGNTVSAYPYDFLGYTPTSPSLAVKFAFWPSGSTTGVYANGDYPSYGSAATIHMDPIINLQSLHVFNVSLVYDGVTLQQTVTDTATSASFTHNYTVDIPTTINGIDAYVGFTGSAGGSSSIQDILTWSYSATPSSYDVDFAAFPQNLQVYPRNRTTNTATVPVAGSELMGGFTQAVLRVYRNGVQVGADQVQALNYSGGSAPFSFNPTISAELAHYDVELLVRNNSNQLFSVQRSQDIVAGDVIVIQGQSNALAKIITNSTSASAYTSPFIRTLGIESDWAPASTASASWMVASGDGVFGQDSLTAIGQWGLVMAKQLVTTNNIPIAIINGALGGQTISFFQRNDALHGDLSTNYGRLLRRLQLAGAAGAVRTILFYQGESDKNDAATHQNGFTMLRSDWLEDYPSLEKLYVFQVRETSGSCNGDVVRFNVDLRNRQRLFADQFPNLTVMSTTGLDAHDGCHFYFTNGYEKMGLNIARMLQRDLYNGSSLPNTDPPNPAYAVLTGATKNLIRIALRNRTDAVTFSSNAIADFKVIGSAVSIVSGSVANGVINLNLSGNATGATQIVYTGHSGNGGQPGNWVANANGVGLLSFVEPLVLDMTPPVITLIGANPFTVNLGATYVDPGATATDNVDGNLTAYIVVNTSAVNTAVPGDYPVTYNVTDVAGNAATQVTRTVHVNANGAPTANPQSVTTNEDTPKSITLTGSDPESDPLTFTVVTNPAHGALSGTVPNLTYTPAANYNGPDSFTFKVNDGVTDSNTATVSITVNAVNDPPVADPQSVTTNEDTPKAITLTGTDIDGDMLSFSVVTSPVHGTLSGMAPNLTYTPAANYNGPDSFTFKVNDGTVDSNIATVSITVIPVNDAPTADPQSVTTNEDTAKAITLTAADVDGDPLTFIVVTQPTHGVLSGTAPNVTYTPATDYNGPDSFTFKANDGTADSNIATVSITVTPVNDAPIADPQSVTTDEDTAKAITLTATDVDGDALTFSVVAQPTHGTLSGTAPNLTYTPAADYNGPDSFTFKANDGTVDSNTATISITVTAVNDAPIATPQSVTTNEDTAKAITLSGTDVEGDALTFSVVTQPSHGVLTGTAPDLIYTPATDYNGPDSFTFKANDGTTDSAPATVSITVTAVNDAPVADPQSVTTNEDTAKAITLTATDVDGDALTFSVVAQPTHGSLSGMAPNLTYTPAADYNGPDSFTFKANDGTVDSNIATVSITVIPVNDPPVATPQSLTTNEDTAKAITLSGTDVEGDTLTFSVVTQPIHGTLSGTAPDLTYTPAADYNGPDSFTFKANDGTADSAPATISITVIAVNDAPVADPQSVTTNEDTAKVITLTATDVDGDLLTFSVVTQPTHGTLSGTAPDLTYTPAADYNGPDSFTFKANDGTVDSNLATISITINPVDDAPTISDIPDTSINEDETTGAISFTLGDAETAPSSLTVSGTSSNTTLVPNANIVFGGSGANRTLTITPAPNQNGMTTITVSVNDGTNTTEDTFVLTVNAVNDAPIADDQSVTTNQNAPLAITLTGSDIETVPGSLTFQVTVSPAHGTLTGTPPNLGYSPTTDYHGSDSFKFTVTDTGDGASPPLTSAEATISIAVNGVPEIAVEQPTGTDLSDGGSTVDFGDVIVDENNSHTFTIRNLGGADLTGLEITVDGTNANEFAITATPTAPLGPGASTTFTIKFAPTTEGMHTAAIHISSNDADEDPFDIALTGTGITNLEAWRMQYFGSMDDNGPGADGNDFDSDGLSNMLEFATGNDPTVSSPMPGTLHLNGDTIEFVYTRAKAAINDGFTFNVEWSDDLASPNWNSAGVTEEILSEDSTLQQIKASVSAASGARKFLRLNIISP